MRMDYSPCSYKYSHMRKPKEKKFKAICRYCGVSFMSADVKTYTCSVCKMPKPCKCGCGELVMTPSREYTFGHKIRGKTYLEIHGTSTPNCGHRKGEANAAKRPEVRKKISDGVKRSYQNPQLIQSRREKCVFLKRKWIDFSCRFPANDGQKYRSRFEVEVADTLYGQGIQYEYEHKITMEGGKLKIVDFKVGNLLIEVTGYAFDDWRQSFNKNIILLRHSVDNPIVIITYEKHTDELQQLVDLHKLQSTLVLGSNYQTKLVELCKQSPQDHITL